MQRGVLALFIVVAASLIAYGMILYRERSRDAGRSLSAPPVGMGGAADEGMAAAGPHPFPPIEVSEVIAADAASPQWVRPDELVLGVVVNEKARAYPINMMVGPVREIINDTLGGRPIAATW